MPNISVILVFMATKSWRILSWTGKARGGRILAHYRSSGNAAAAHFLERDERHGTILYRFDRDHRPRRRLRDPGRFS
jgi:hypothetical protein